jgi:hypothetical protein
VRTHGLGRAAAVVLFAVVCAPAIASARSYRVEDLPNGSANDCANCHDDGPGNPRNEFGSDAQAALDPTVSVSVARVLWAELCPQDSDADGWTNGEELGDPDCVWIRGEADPIATVYNPGRTSSHPPSQCGNGRLEPDEDCEGSELRSTDCAAEGAGDGPLSCGPDCLFDYAACSEPPTEGVGGGSSSASGGALPDSSESSSGCTMRPSTHPGARRSTCAWVLALTVVSSVAALRRRRARTPS